VAVAIAAGRIGTMDAMQTTKEVVSAFMEGKFGELHEDLLAKSSVLKTRNKHWVLELRKKMGEPVRQQTFYEAVLPGKTGDRIGGGIADARQAVLDSAFFLQQKVDDISSVVIWLSAYKRNEGKLPEEERIKYADKAVEDTLPQLEKMSQAAFLRDKTPWAGLVLFYGYFNKLFNLVKQDYGTKVADPYRQWKYGEGSAMDLAKGVARFAGEMMAIFMITNVAAEWMSGRGQEENEDIWKYLARKMLAAPLTLVPFGAPIGEAVGRAATGLEARGGKAGVVSFRQAPGLAAIERVLKAGGDVLNDDKEFNERVWAGAEAFLFANGLPATQWRRTGQYVTDWLTGEKSPESIGEAGSGFLYGALRREQPDNPLLMLDRVQRGEPVLRE
jgi:hypothetical protein